MNNKFKKIIKFPMNNYSILITTIIIIMKILLEGVRLIIKEVKKEIIQKDWQQITYLIIKNNKVL